MAFTSEMTVMRTAAVSKIAPSMKRDVCKRR